MAVRTSRAVCRLPPEAVGLPQSGTSTTRHINLGEKQTGKPIDGNRHDGFEEAGAGNQLTVGLAWIPTPIPHLTTIVIGRCDSQASDARSVN